MKLKLSVKELKCIQEMVATDVGMEHLLKQQYRRASTCHHHQACLCLKNPSVKLLLSNQTFLIEGLVLLAGNTTID